jgi:hypothetical protein
VKHRIPGSSAASIRRVPVGQAVIAIAKTQAQADQDWAEALRQEGAGEDVIGTVFARLTLIRRERRE